MYLTAYEYCGYILCTSVTSGQGQDMIFSDAKAWPLHLTMQQQTVTKFEQLSRSCALVWNHTPDYMHKIVEYLNCQHWKTFWSAESDVLLQFFQLILLLMWRPFPGMPDFYLRSLTCAKFHCLWTVPKAAAKPLACGNRCDSDRLWHPLPLLNKMNPKKILNTLIGWPMLACLL